MDLYTYKIQSGLKSSYMRSITNYKHQKVQLKNGHLQADFMNKASDLV